MADFLKVDKNGDVRKLDGTPTGVSQAPAKSVAQKEQDALNDPVAALVDKYKIPQEIVGKVMSRKDTIGSIIQANLDGLQRDYIMEKYYNKQLIIATAGSQVWRQQLGVIQQSIKGKVAIVEYLTPLYLELE